MKKLFVTIPVVFCSMITFGQNTTRIPSSVTLLGETSINNYLLLVEKGQQIEENIFAMKTRFTDLHSLVLYADKISNSSEPLTDLQITAVESLLNSVVESRGDYSSIVNGLTISPLFKSIVTSILDKVKTIDDAADLDNILLPYAETVDQMALAGEEKEKLRLYITALNANHDVIMNSNWLKQKQQELDPKGTETMNGRRGILGTLWDIIKCVLGTAGSTIAGGIGGAGIGSISIPVVGTVSGTVIGAIAGAAVGVASFC